MRQGQCMWLRFTKCPAVPRCLRCADVVSASLVLPCSAIAFWRSGQCPPWAQRWRYREPEEADCNSWKVLSKQRFRSEYVTTKTLFSSRDTRLIFSGTPASSWVQKMQIRHSNYKVEYSDSTIRRYTIRIFVLLTNSPYARKTNTIHM